MSKKLYKEDTAAASASINKTLREIDALLEGEKLSKAGKLRSKLRKTLIEVLEDIGKTWYRKGFNRGHIEAFSEAKSSGKVPKDLKAEKKRKIIKAGNRLTIKLRSKIRKK